MKSEIISGSYRGDTLYNMISNGEAVPDAIVDDLIGEAMMWTAQGSDVLNLTKLKNMHVKIIIMTTCLSDMHL